MFNREWSSAHGVVRTAGAAVLAMLIGVVPPAAGQVVTFESLLDEMTDGEALARFPHPAYRSLQASSYNRESTHRDKPGWFADSDGTGFIREEVSQAGRTEWVIMEHDGPGCLARVWTPFFYYDLSDHRGPDVRVYLDGAAQPVIDEPLIALVTGKGSMGAPFARATARAGNLYLPVPFAQRCKVTLSAKPFYYIINYRAYGPGVQVQTFSPSVAAKAEPALKRASEALVDSPVEGSWRLSSPARMLGAGAELVHQLPHGAAAVREIVLTLPGAAANPAELRSLVVALEFDGSTCAWAPVGDLFCSADALHPFTTLRRSATGEGVLRCRWVMPYRSTAVVRLVNTGRTDIEVATQIATGRWAWDERSMHFHAGWRADEVIPGDTFVDWNFVDLAGKGVYVGDAWTVLNPQRGAWWGEGDEKIYVDGAWESGFPTHFGTGTEDYYGWAGGEVPTRRDEFSHPFVANVRVGGLDGTTLGYNIVTRERALDAIPFESRLRMDMECSPGVDIRGAHHRLGYSSISFWYAIPGSTDNRPPAPDQAGRAIMKLQEEAGRERIVR